MFHNTVWERVSSDSSGIELGERVYNLVIGLVLGWGFFLNWYMIRHIPASRFENIKGIWLILGFFFVSFLGTFIYTKARFFLVSFIGYNLVVLAFGVILNLIVSRFEPHVILGAIQIGAVVTVVMVVMGTVNPEFFWEVEHSLFLGLGVGLAVELFAWIVLGAHLGILDWIVALIFAGYIGLDWARANDIPPTLDNAVDSAGALYVDIINLFIRLLMIRGRRD